jgi:hypothetical protein
VTGQSLLPQQSINEDDGKAIWEVPKSMIDFLVIMDLVRRRPTA